MKTIFLSLSLFFAANVMAADLKVTSTSFKNNETIQNKSLQIKWSKGLEDSIEARTDFGKPGYGCPCPPPNQLP